MSDKCYFESKLYFKGYTKILMNLGVSNIFLAFLFFAVTARGASEECTTKVDLAFVSDHSGSLDPSEFGQLKDFLVAMAGQFDIGPDDAQIGSTWFGSTSGVNFNFDTYSTLGDVQNAINSINQMGGLTNLEGGIQKARFLTGIRGGIIPKIMLIITDGEQNLGDAQFGASLATAEGWKIVAIGVGNNVDSNLLDEISVGNDYYVDDFGALSNLLNILSVEVCIYFCDAPAIAHSNAGSTCDNTIAGNLCSFGCDDGFEIQSGGNAVVQCGADAEWEMPLPICEEIPFCSAPNIANSNAGFLCDDYERGHSCEFECNTGYQITHGNPIITCGSDGDWGSLPVCQEIVVCDPPHIPNSNSAEACFDKEAGDSCIYRCEEGYAVLSGMPYITCLPDGSWENPPPCDEALGGSVQLPNIDDPDTVLRNLQFTEKMSDALYDQIYNVFGKLLLRDNEDIDDLALNLGNLDASYNWDPVVISVEGCEDVDEDCLYYVENRDECSDTAFGSPMSDRCPLSCGVCASKTYTPIDKFTNLDRQPFKKDSSFFDQYKFLLDFALNAGPLNEDNFEQVNELINEISEYEELRDKSSSPVVKNIYNRLISEIEAKINVLMPRNPVQDLRDKLSEHTVLGKYSMTVLEGTTERIFPNYFATPSSAEIRQLFDERSAEDRAVFNISIHTNTVIHREYEEYNTAFFVAYNEGKYRAVMMQEGDFDMELDFEFNKWAEVLVRPDGWYDDSWMQVVQMPQYLSDSYTLDYEPGQNKLPVWGERGLMNSLTRRLVVVQDVRLQAHLNMSLFEEFGYYWQNAESVRIGPFCTGKACYTKGNVHIGGNSLANGARSGGQNTGEWKYMEYVAKDILDLASRQNNDGTIAILGASEPTPNDAISSENAGTAIKSITIAPTFIDNGVSTQFYDGVDEINAFFDDLYGGTVNPALIWIASTSSVNGLDANEGHALAMRANEINDFARSGGGVIAHGSGDAAFEWVRELIQDFEEISGSCDTSSHAITPVALERFPSLKNYEDNISCSSYYRGVFGNLESLVQDGSGESIMIGGYGSIGDTPDYSSASDGNYTTTFSTDPLDPGKFKMDVQFVKTEPAIMATYAPRFPY